METLKKTEKRLNSFWVIVQAILSFFIGITILNKDTMYIYLFEYLIAIYFFVTGMIEILKKTILKRNKKIKITGIVLALLNILIAVIIAKNPGIVLPAFSYVFTMYIAIVAVTKTIVLGIYLNNGIKGKIIVLAQVILSYIFAVILIKNPYIRGNISGIIAGIYFILLSLTYIFDAIEILIPFKYIKLIKRRSKIVMPVFIASFLPKTSLEKIEEKNRKQELKMLEGNNIEEIDYKEADMEILVYIKNRGKEIFGHADVFFDGKIYSYGPYDKSSNILESLIGDGVLFETEERLKYIDLCTRYSSMTVISYGLKLNDEQKTAVNKAILEIKKDTYSWQSNEEKGIKSRDYASVLNRRTGAKFFKFKEGKFKKYFSFNTNCVLFMDKIIGSIGIDIARFTGIITPGTYYDYFNRQYKLKNSMVIFRKVYKREKKLK